MMQRTTYLLLIVVVMASSSWAQQPDEGWQQLDTGLELGVFLAPMKSTVGDGKITVLRVDPHAWQFQLMAAADHGGRSRTAKQ